jgi:hypothetical protein
MKLAYVARHPMTASRELGGEMIVLSAGDSRLFTLNGAGALIWKAADGRTLLQDIVARTVCVEYDVNAAVAQADAETFVAEMIAHGVMVSGDAPIEAGPDGAR